MSGLLRPRPVLRAPAASRGLPWSTELNWHAVDWRGPSWMGVGWQAGMPSWGQRGHVRGWAARLLYVYLRDVAPPAPTSAPSATPPPWWAAMRRPWPQRAAFPSTGHQRRAYPEPAPGRGLPPRPAPIPRGAVLLPRPPKPLADAPAQARGPVEAGAVPSTEPSRAVPSIPSPAPSSSSSARPAPVRADRAPATTRRDRTQATGSPSRAPAVTAGRPTARRAFVPDMPAESPAWPGAPTRRRPAEQRTLAARHTAPPQAEAAEIAPSAQGPDAPTPRWTATRKLAGIRRAARGVLLIDPAGRTPEHSTAQLSPSAGVPGPPTPVRGLSPAHPGPEGTGAAAERTARPRPERAGTALGPTKSRSPRWHVGPSSWGGTLGDGPSLTWQPRVRAKRLRVPFGSGKRVLLTQDATGTAATTAEAQAQAEAAATATAALPHDSTLPPSTPVTRRDGPAGSQLTDTERRATTRPPGAASSRRATHHSASDGRGRATPPGHEPEASVESDWSTGHRPRGRTARRRWSHRSLTAPTPWSRGLHRPDRPSWTASTATGRLRLSWGDAKPVDLAGVSESAPVPAEPPGPGRSPAPGGSPAPDARTGIPARPTPAGGRLPGSGRRARRTGTTSGGPMARTPPSPPPAPLTPAPFSHAVVVPAT